MLEGKAWSLYIDLGLRELLLGQGNREIQGGGGHAEQFFLPNSTSMVKLKLYTYFQGKQIQHQHKTDKPFLTTSQTQMDILLWRF